MRRFLVRAAYAVNAGLGEWVARQLGYVKFINTEFTRQHAPDCRQHDTEFLLRVGGYVKRCRTCQRPVVIKLACWETDSGHMPPEVVRWIAEELHALASVEGA